MGEIGESWMIIVNYTIMVNQWIFKNCWQMMVMDTDRECLKLMAANGWHWLLGVGIVRNQNHPASGQMGTPWRSSQLGFPSWVLRPSLQGERINQKWGRHRSTNMVSQPPSPMGNIQAAPYRFVWGSSGHCDGFDPQVWPSACWFPVSPMMLQVSPLAVPTWPVPHHEHQR